MPASVRPAPATPRHTTPSRHAPCAPRPRARPAPPGARARGRRALHRRRRLLGEPPPTRHARGPRDHGHRRGRRRARRRASPPRAARCATCDLCVMCARACVQGAARAAAFHGPHGLAQGPAGEVIVADAYNQARPCCSCCSCCSCRRRLTHCAQCLRVVGPLVLVEGATDMAELVQARRLPPKAAGASALSRAERRRGTGAGRGRDSGWERRQGASRRPRAGGDLLLPA